ncbi:Endonuclease/exonuclease/phosphatase, partial [Lactarius quietus]
MNDRINEFEKWAEINSTVKRDKIAILALQETHLDEDTVQRIQNLFGKRLQILNSQLERNPRSSAGVAFVLNKDLIETKTATTQELIKGRGLKLTVQWNEQVTTLINVYAPNRRQDHEDFWATIVSETKRLDMRKPDFVLGDFNVTKNVIDRFPPKPDNAEAIAALRDLRQTLEVQDQWRHEYPKSREYTYRATANGNTIRSRLDRVYVAKDKTKYTFDWEMTPSTVKTDHWLVSVRFAPKNAPYIGKGRWTIPIKALNNRKIIDKAREKGMILQEEIRELIRHPNNRSPERNPQSLWNKFKYFIIKWAEFIT